MLGDIGIHSRQTEAAKSQIHLIGHAVAGCSLIMVTVAVVGETRLFRASIASHRLTYASAAELCNALQLFVVEKEVEGPYIAILSYNMSNLRTSSVTA